MNLKKILIIFGILVALVGIPITIVMVRQQQDIRNRAAGGDTLTYLVPSANPSNNEITPTIVAPTSIYSTGEIHPGDIFSIQVYISNPSSKISAAIFDMNYNSTLLEVVNLEPNQNAFTDRTYGHTAGLIKFLGAYDNNTGFIQGNQPVARITFRAKAIGDAQVNFTMAQITADDGDGVQTLYASKIQGGTYRITQLTANSPTPIRATSTTAPTATLIPTATKTPTPIPPTATPDVCAVTFNKQNDCTCTNSSQCNSGYCNTTTTNRCETTPECNTNIVCSTSCTAPSNTCGANNGTKACWFTANTVSGNICSQKATTSQPCSVNNCLSTRVCVNGSCVAPSATPTHTPTPTNTPTPTATPTRTPTPIPPTATHTPTASPTQVVAVDTCPLKSKGDANCDGKVNPQDFVLWKAEYLAQGTNKTSDFNGDNTVNPQDFVIWKAGYLDTSISH